MKINVWKIFYCVLPALAIGATTIFFLSYKKSSLSVVFPNKTEKPTFQTHLDRKPTDIQNSLSATIEGGPHPGTANMMLIDEFKKALRNPSISQRTQRFIFLLEAMRSEDALDVRGLFLAEDVKNLKFEVEWGAFWVRWGEVNAQGAMRNLLESMETGIADDINMSRAAGLVMRTWGAADPAAARAWFGDMDVGEASKFGIIQMIGGWAERDLLAALKYTTAPDISPRIRDHYFIEVTKAAVERKDKAIFEKYLEMLPDDSSRARTMPYLVNSLLQENPNEARRLIDLYPHIKWKGEITLSKLAIKLSKYNPSETTRWVAGLQVSSEKDGKNKAIFQGLGRWLETDAASATAWLSTQNGQAWYDYSVVLTAQFLIKNNHPEAAAWVDAVKDPKEKIKLQTKSHIHYNNN